MRMSTPEAVIAILGLAALSVLTRGFFLLPRKAWPLPSWLRRGLAYAPLAALTAVIAPEILMSGGHFLSTWRDARWMAAAVALAYYGWRRGILGTMLAGMAVYLPLHLGLGW